MSVYFCREHPEVIYDSGAAPIECPKCGNPIVDTETGERKAIRIGCSTGDGSSVVIGRCASGDCEFIQTRDPLGRVTGEVHLKPGIITWGMGEQV